MRRNWQTLSNQAMVRPMSVLLPNGLGARAAQRCRDLSRPPYSEEPDNLTRRFLTPAHRETLDAISGWMTGAGMKSRLDHAGTLTGRLEGQQPDAPALVFGSHVDSVRDAGAFDGMLGVLLGLACCEAFHAAKRKPPFPIEVVGFGDEEGSRFQASMNGSRAFAGRLDPERALEALDRDGETLEQALKTFGLDPQKIGAAARERGTIRAFVEPHIEQGPVLEAQDRALGVVTSIAGQWRIKVKLTGRAGHAGTTPMPMRADALAAAAECVVAIETIAAEAGSDLVATVGQIMAKPGAPNVIPGLAEFTIDVRSGTDSIRDAALAQIEEQVRRIATRRNVTCTIDRVQNLPATAMDAKLQALLQQACGEAPGLVSGAGHDAMMIAGAFPSAMLFIRCAGGVSHNPAENVMDEDCEAALAALLRFIDLLAAEPQ